MQKVSNSLWRLNGWKEEMLNVGCECAKFWIWILAPGMNLQPGNPELSGNRETKHW